MPHGRLGSLGVGLGSKVAMGLAPVENGLDALQMDAPRGRPLAVRKDISQTPDEARRQQRLVHLPSLERRPQKGQAGRLEMLQDA